MTLDTFKVKLRHRTTTAANGTVIYGNRATIITDAQTADMAVQEALRRVARTDAERQNWTVTDVTMRCRAMCQPRRDSYGQVIDGTGMRCARYSHHHYCHTHGDALRGNVLPKAGV